MQYTTRKKKILVLKVMVLPPIIFVMVIELEVKYENLVSNLRSGKSKMKQKIQQNLNKGYKLFSIMADFSFVNTPEPRYNKPRFNKFSVDDVNIFLEWRGNNSRLINDY